jgi:hypothetical protein
MSGECPPSALSGMVAAADLMQPAEFQSSEDAANSAGGHSLSAIHSFGFDPSVVERALVFTEGDEQQAVNLILEGLVPAALELQQTVSASGTSPVWDALSFGQQDCSFHPSATLSHGSSGGSSADHHSDVPPHLLQSIETSDPGTKEIEICGMELGESGCRILARALSMNTCVTTLTLGLGIGPAGAALLFGALAHLTTMTHLNLNTTDLYPAGAVHLCSVLPHLTALTELKLSRTCLQSSGAAYLCCALPQLTAITDLHLMDNELTLDDAARICGAVAAAGMTCLKNLVLLELSNSFSACDVVDCGTWQQLRLPRPPQQIIGECSMMNFAPIVSFILNSGGAWREATMQCLVTWRESAVLPPPVIEKGAVNTIDRWSGWSAANVPGIACMLACFKHFTLSSLFNDHRALPKPMKIYFIHQHLDASGGLRPRERVRLGSCGLMALLLRRICQQLPFHQRSSHRFAVKSVNWAISRVCSWLPNSDIDTAFLTAIQNEDASQFKAWSLDQKGQDIVYTREYLDEMSERDRARLLTSDTCRKILTNTVIDPVNDWWLHFEISPGEDVFPRPVICDLADGIMRNLYENMEGGEFYCFHENWPDYWRGGVEYMSKICPHAVTKFVCSRVFFDLCNSISLENGEFEFSSKSRLYEYDSSFTCLCCMLADVAQVNASLLQPCAPLLLEVLHPHWNYMFDPQVTFAAFRAALVSDAVNAAILTACHLTPFPMKYCEHLVLHCEDDDSGVPPPKKAKVLDAPSDVYMQRLAAILQDQRALHCFELRVEGLIGQPCKTMTCSPSDSVAVVLHSACAMFGIAAAEWRFYRDKGRREEVPLEETLDSCSISEYFTLYLG